MRTEVAEIELLLVGIELLLARLLVKMGNHRRRRKVKVVCFLLGSLLERSRFWVLNLSL